MSDTCQLSFSPFIGFLPTFAFAKQKDKNDMKKRFLMGMLFAVFGIVGAKAQEANDSINLGEVVVKASRIVNKVDGMLVYPSNVQKQNSHSGLSLLSKLALPNIRIDETQHTISAVDMKGSVQVRINGVVATMNDLLMLDMGSILSVDYINSPGVRYGKDVAYVIDVRTKRSEVGSTMGFEFMNALTTLAGRNNVFGSFNHGKSQFSLFYEFGYADHQADKMQQDARYLLNDGTEYLISRQTITSQCKRYNNSLQLKYNLADSASYVFQTTLSLGFENQPRTFGEFRISENSSEYIAHSSNKSRDFTPVLDLYFYHQLGKHQSLTADMLGTYIRTKSDSYYDEKVPSRSIADGNTYSLIGEAIYENRLKPFTLSAGLRLNWKYMDNVYSGDVESVNSIHSSGIYGFSEIKGSLAKLNYVAGFGLSNQRYRQGEYHYNFWLSRPKLTLAYPFTSAWQLRYVFELSQHVSQVAMISDTRIRNNSMEWTVGNPSLRPSGRYENTLMLMYQKPRISSNLELTYRINRRPNLAKYTRTEDNQFLYTQASQPYCNMLYVSNYTNFQLIPEHLSLMVNGGIYRFFNKGDDYFHCYTAYNYGASLQAYWGKWSVSAYADNGWNFMEGEMIGHQPMNLTASITYRIGDFTLSLYMQNPFMAHPKTDSAEFVNAMLHKQITSRNSVNGNVVYLNVAWNISRGKKYRDIEKSIQNKERETGILK